MTTQRQISIDPSGVLRPDLGVLGGSCKSQAPGTGEVVREPGVRGSDLPSRPLNCRVGPSVSGALWLLPMGMTVPIPPKRTGEREGHLCSNVSDPKI